MSNKLSSNYDKLLVATGNSKTKRVRAVEKREHTALELIKLQENRPIVVKSRWIKRRAADGTLCNVRRDGTLDYRTTL